MKCGKLFLLGMLVAGSVADARSGWYDELGITATKKLCKECHGTPYKIAAMHTGREWSKLFRKDAKKLIAAHASVPQSQEMFASSYFKNRRDNLASFLTQSASDSGVVPGCDGNDCGD